MVRNPNPNALIIEKIFVGDGLESPYAITVAGNETDIVENQHILGNDSLLVLVSVTIDPSDNTMPFVVRDSIVFITNGTHQDVKLQSWGQNAHFIGDLFFLAILNGYLINPISYMVQYWLILYVN